MKARKLTPFEEAAIFLSRLPKNLSFQFMLHFKISQLDRFEGAAQAAMKRGIEADKVAAAFVSLEKLPEGKDLEKFINEHFGAILLKIRHAIYPAGGKETSVEAVRNILAGKPESVGALLLATLEPARIVEALSEGYSTKERVIFAKELECIYEYHGEPVKTLRDIITGLSAKDPDFIQQWENAKPIPQIEKYDIEVIALMRKLGRTFEEICIMSEQRVKDILALATDKELAQLLRCENEALQEKFFAAMPIERGETVRARISGMSEFTIADAWAARETVVDIIRKLWQKGELEYLERGMRRKVCPSCGALSIIPIEKRRVIMKCEHCGENSIVRPKKTISRRHSDIHMRIEGRVELPPPTAKELELLVREFDRELKGLREKIQFEFFGFDEKAELSTEEREKYLKIFSEFGRNLAQDFSCSLFVNCSILLVSLGQKTCMEATMSFPEITNIYLLTVRGYPEKILFEMNRATVKMIVEMLAETQRKWEEAEQGFAWSSVERRVYHHFLNKLAREFSKALGMETPLVFTIHKFFDSPAEVEDFAPDRYVIQASYNVMLEGKRGSMNLCIPLWLLKNFISGDGRSE
jgi:flagellar motor switch protein FliG/predicted RNA-binding Zn-ribbon protein involved in translation (DUF1610 family)